MSCWNSYGAFALASSHDAHVACAFTVPTIIPLGHGNLPISTLTV